MDPSLRHVRFDQVCILVPDLDAAGHDQGPTTGAVLWRALSPMKSLLPQGWVGGGSQHTRRTSSGEFSSGVGEDGVLITSPRLGRMTSSVSTHRKVSAASSAHSAELPKSCIKTSVSSPNSPPLQHLPGSFPFASTTSHHSRTPSVSPTPSSSLSPFATEPLLACCPTCNETTDLALQLGPAYRIQWTPGAAAKKKRDDLEEQRDILSGLKINCQKWREVLPDEAEQDGYANPLDYDDEVVLSDEEDEAKDRQQQSACRVLSKLDGLSSNCSKHRLNKDWTPDRYYDTQDNEDDLFPMPSPVVSPSPRLLTPISGSPNVSSSNLPGQVTGFFPPATIPGSTSQSLSPSAATAEMTREDSFGGRSSKTPSPLSNSHSAEDIADDEENSDVVHDLVRKTSSPLLTYTSPSKPRPKPKISIPPSSSSSSLASPSPPSVLPSAHQLQPLSSKPHPGTRGQQQQYGVPPSVASSSSRSAASSGAGSGRMYTSGGFVPPPLPSESGSGGSGGGRRSATHRQNSSTSVVGKILLERAEGTGRSPLVVQRSGSPAAAAGMTYPAGRGLQPTRKASQDTAIVGVGNGSGEKLDNAKMPTYSATQREVVIIASSRASTERARGSQSQQPPLATPPAEKSKEKSLPTLPPAMPDRQMSSTSTKTTDSQATAHPRADSEKDDDTPNGSTVDDEPPQKRGKQRSVDEFGGVGVGVNGDPSSRAGTVTAPVQQETAKPRSAPPRQPTSRSYTHSMPTVPQGRQYSAPTVDAAAVSANNRRAMAAAAQSSYASQQQQNSKPPPNVLRRAGSGTNLRLARPDTNNTDSSSHNHRPHHQTSKSLSPVPTNRLTSPPMMAPLVVPSAGGGPVEHRSRSSSIRKLWKGVLGGASGAIMGGSNVGAAVGHGVGVR